jgi:ubiquinone/menaquinone biosynthesis C-methylase UbiE
MDIVGYPSQCSGGATTQSGLIRLTANRRGLNANDAAGLLHCRAVCMTHAAEIARMKAIYERMAGGYDRMIATWERLLFADGRQWVCSQARGDVLEIGVGTAAISTGIPTARIWSASTSARLCSAAPRHELGSSRRDADLQLGDAQALSFASESFDAVW